MNNLKEIIEKIIVIIISAIIVFIAFIINLFTVDDTDCVGCPLKNCSDYKKYHGKECRIYKNYIKGD